MALSMNLLVKNGLFFTGPVKNDFFRQLRIASRQHQFFSFQTEPCLQLRLRKIPIGCTLQRIRSASRILTVKLKIPGKLFFKVEQIAKVKNYNLNVTEVLDSTLKKFSRNFTVGILSASHFNFLIRKKSVRYGVWKYQNYAKVGSNKLSHFQDYFFFFRDVKLPFISFDRHIVIFRVLYSNQIGCFDTSSRIYLMNTKNDLKIILLITQDFVIPLIDQTDEPIRLENQFEKKSQYLSKLVSPQ